MAPEALQVLQLFAKWWLIGAAEVALFWALMIWVQGGSKLEGGIPSKIATFIAGSIAFGFVSALGWIFYQTVVLGR